MKAFKVTALYQGTLDTWTVYGHNSVSGVKKSITEHWNKEHIYDVKIVKVEPLGEVDEIVFDAPATGYG